MPLCFFRGCMQSNGVTDSDVKRCKKTTGKCCKMERWRVESENAEIKYG